MHLLEVARVPPITASPDTTVWKAISMMAENEVGAVVVCDREGKVLGIFTERDNMLRMTLKHKDPDKTVLAEVMTAPVTTAPPEMNPDEALTRMIRSRYRHLPIVDPKGRILGVASVRNLLMRRIDKQDDSLETLAAYVSAGGPG